MTVKTRLTALIVATCIIVAGALGIIAWTLAAANITVSSTLLVTYTASPHVVGTVDATYQKTTDASATAFKSGTITMKYGDEGGSKNLNVSDDALILNDTNTYVVFEFKFYNNNAMADKGITISLTDNGLCSNMTRKYYFGDLSSKTISEKESTIKNSGIENSALSSTSVTIGQKETTYVYMLLEITPSYQASYTADDTNQFIFNLTSTEVTPSKKGSYLSADWATRIKNMVSGASIQATNINSGRRILSSTSSNFGPATSFDDIVGLPEPNTDGSVTTYISFSNVIPTGYSYQCSVGTNSESSTDAYVQSNIVFDVVAYINKTCTYDRIVSSYEVWEYDIVFYSPGTIYAPSDSSGLFQTQTGGFSSIWLEGSYWTNATYGDYSLLDISKVTNFTNMFEGNTVQSYPANFPEEYK